MIALSSIDLRSLVEISHATISQKISFWPYIFIAWEPLHASPSYIGLQAYSLSVVTQHMQACYFCWKPQITSPLSKQCDLSQIFLVPSIVSMQATLFRHETVLLAQKKNLLTHKCHIALMTQDAFASVQLLSWLISQLDCLLILYMPWQCFSHCTDSQTAW